MIKKILVGMVLLSSLAFGETIGLVEKYYHQHAEDKVQNRIDNGWRVVSMAGLTSGFVIVYYEKQVVDMSGGL